MSILKTQLKELKSRVKNEEEEMKKTLLVSLVALTLLPSCAKKTDSSYPLIEDFSDFKSPEVDEDSTMDDLVDDEEADCNNGSFYL